MKFEASRDSLTSFGVIAKNGSFRSSSAVALSSGLILNHNFRNFFQSSEKDDEILGYASVILSILSNVFASPSCSGHGCFPVSISTIIHPNCQISYAGERKELLSLTTSGGVYHSDPIKGKF